MGLLWIDEAWQEYLDWQEQDKKTLKRPGGGVDVLMKRIVLYTNLSAVILLSFPARDIITTNNYHTG